VEIKAIAREAGYRSKVAVAARQDGIDPVGCCVGLRGIRIQNIVNELSGEKLDVIMWNPDTSTFITGALSPAQVLSVELDEENGIATVIVPDKQLSLAIGKEGQNARLAARLTGWRIDIKNASVAEAERIAKAKPVTEEAKLVTEIEEEAIEEAIISGELPTEVPAILEPALVPSEAPADEVAEPLPSLDSASIPQEISFEQPTTAEKPQLRFAEEILVAGPSKPGTKSRKKKKSARGKEHAEDSIRGAKPRQAIDFVEDDEY
jgi:N utilization substance protein A